MAKNAGAVAFFALGMATVVYFCDAHVRFSEDGVFFALEIATVVCFCDACLQKCEAVCIFCIENDDSRANLRCAFAKMQGCRHFLH